MKVNIKNFKKYSENIQHQNYIANFYEIFQIAEINFY